VSAATVQESPTPAPRRHLKVKRLVYGGLAVLVAGAFAQLLGWNLRDWLESLWDAITGISPVYVVAGATAGFAQTTATAFGWWAILRYGFPNAPVRWRQIWAAYAASVALNGILPANLGTLVMLLMFTTLIAGATFPAVLGGYAVQKIFYCVFGAIPYLYLFFTVAGSFDIKFGFIRDHPWASAVLLIGGGVLVAGLVRGYWSKVTQWWSAAKGGGAILGHPRAYFLEVFLPGIVSWIAMLCVIGAFLAAYEIPVTFDTLMRVVAGNSIANVTSVTPGGVGVTQAFNVASLQGVTTSANATAFSVTQQLVMTAWNILVALILLAWAFGWSSGRSLLETSYAEAKQKAATQRAARSSEKATAQDRPMPAKGPSG
jgi:uncharacterized membrane protein YbhN (UPF0104 family)